MIKDASVRIVKDFIDSKVPLSEGVAKYAQEMELNPEQIKRVVETCNTVTYLTLQKEATDRTFEFPVADYNQVMASMVVPSKPDGTVTEAEFKQAQEKQAAVVGKYEPDLQMVQAWTMTEYRRNKVMLENLEIEKEACVQNIGDVVKNLKKDEWALEKLAEVSDEPTFAKLSLLLRELQKEAGLRPRVFKDKELDDVRKLVDLYKEAQDLAVEFKRRTDLEKRGVAQALAGGLGSAIGGTVGVTTGLAGRGVVHGIKRIGKSKIIHPLDIAATALNEPNPASNVWDNLQGKQKRF